jgi:hypothetical protein
MRKVRHKNIVQFIGACTQKPNLCIVFEFMSGGSVYDYIRKVRGGWMMCVVCCDVWVAGGVGAGREAERGVRTGACL